MDDKLQSAVEGLIDAVDKQHFRSIRKQAFLCSAACCDAKGTHEELQACVTSCQTKMVGAESVLGAELEAFQGRLQRCAMTCRDSVADKVTAQPTPQELNALQAQVDTCASKCVDDNVASLGAMKKRVDDALARLR